MFVALNLRHVNEVHFAPDDGIPLVVGDQVIVRTVRAKDIAEVVALCEHHRGCTAENAFVKKILRTATEKDLQREDENRLRERKAHLIAVKKIERLSLPMKLIRVHYLFDHSRIIFFFKAATKVDFRQLVRDLAAVFKTRIELRQIGVRDEAKILGGTGSCGRELCCAMHLRCFVPVTVKMAKLQHHTVNPSKISGQCGRLKCCLAYEHPLYEETLKGIPPLDSEVTAGEIAGKLVKTNLFDHTAEILKADGTLATVPLEALRNARFAGTSTARDQLTDEERAVERELADSAHGERHPIEEDP
ncbi:MAG: stage 0 sporulation protein [Candidatus Riflebacteria bacterium]|nr:stage 0 sporulation protein [Candidatus Riflebacteria bacterium]